MNTKNHKVTVYSTPTCPYCVYAKDFFKQNNVPFEDIDVTKDQAKAEEMIKKSGQMGVPVVTGTPICCLLYTSPSPRDRQKSRMPSSA